MSGVALGARNRSIAALPGVVQKCPGPAVYAFPRRELQRYLDAP